MGQIKSLWQQLQESKSERKQLSIEELKEAMNNMFSNRKQPVNYIPAHLVLNMNDEDFKSFIKTKNDYRITCNLEQYEMIQKRYKS